MELLNIEKKLHIRIKKLMQFINDYRITSNNDDIINIENQFTPLRICLEVLEKPFFKKGFNMNILQYIEATNKEPATDKLNKLLNKGIIDRYLRDKLNYIYSLLSWKSHLMHDCEKNQSVNKSPFLLMNILEECMSGIFYDLLPKSVALMLESK